MTVHRILAGLAAAAVAAIVAATALAAGATDPKDAGPKLDLKLVSGSVKGGLVTIKVGTYGAAKPGDLSGGLSNLVVLFDSNQDGKIDYRAKIVGQGSKLVAMLSGHGKHFEPLPVKGAGTLSTTFPADVVSVAGKALRIAATSTYQACACQTKYTDRAPNAGWVKAG